MSYLFQFDDNYNSEDDSDYVPGESDDSSEDSYDSDNSDESSEDSESDTVTEIKLKDVIPTHIRIYGGRRMLIKYTKKSTRIRKQPVRYQSK
jgi:hypothetical protein